MKKYVFAAVAASLLLLVGLLVAAVLLSRRVTDHAAHSRSSLDVPPASDLPSSSGWGRNPDSRFRELGLPAPGEPVAAFADQVVLCRDFYCLLIQGYGQQIIAQQVQDRLVQQEETRRGIAVSEAEVEAKVREAREELRGAPGPKKTLEELLTARKMTLDQLKRELRDQIALERMVRRDLRLGDSVAVQDGHISKWIADVRGQAKLRGLREGLRPGVVAMVNGEEVLEADIIRELADRVPRSELQTLVDHLVDEKIIEKLMAEQKIGVSESDVEAMVKNLEDTVHKRPGMDGVTLESYLDASNKTLEDIRKQFRHAIGLRKIVAGQVTEAQLRLAFQEFQEAYTGKTVHAEHIVALAVNVHTMQPKDEQAFDRALAKIQNIEARIRGGASFEEMALKESEDPGSAKKAGDLGFIRRLGDVTEGVAAMVFLLKVNEVSPPVRSAYGYHLVKVVEVRPGKPVRFEDVREQVLKDVVVATCDRWLQTFRRALQITVNLGTMGRVDTTPGAQEPRRTGARPGSKG